MWEAVLQASQADFLGRRRQGGLFMVSFAALRASVVGPYELVEGPKML